MKKKKRKFVLGNKRRSIEQLIEQFIKFLIRLFRILSFPVFTPGAYRQPAYANTVSLPGEMRKKDLRAGDTRRQFWKRLAFGMALRCLATPVVILFSIAAIVYAGAHPEPRPVTIHPDALGLYYESVSFYSEDGTVLQGWFIPSLSAQDVIDEGEKALRRQRPGVVLCHGMGANREQLLPLAAYLNSKGVEVLLFDFRACGQSTGQAITFGLDERNDVIAATHTLMNRGSVDPQKVALIGQGMGGVAALGAASYDHSIRAVVIADVDSNLQTAISRRLGEAGFLAGPFTSAFMWGCKTYLRANDSELSASHTGSLLHQDQSVLLVSREKNRSLKQSAQIIRSNCSAETQTLSVDSVSPCLLTDVAQVLPVLDAYLREIWGE